MRSCTVYKDPARAALLNLKYHHTRWLGEALAWDLALFVNGLGWKADYVVPIPLSKQRTSERGYNQVDLIAHPLAQIMGWPYLTTALQRARHTSSQVGLGRAQRRSNVQGAFVAIAPEIRAKTILLVDDTSTTGSTLDSAAGALIDAGAREVKALTFARALPGHGSDFEKFSPSHSILE